jgi:hypothetical protein
MVLALFSNYTGQEIHIIIAGMPESRLPALEPAGMKIKKERFYASPSAILVSIMRRAAR